MRVVALLVWGFIQILFVLALFFLPVFGASFLFYIVIVLVGIIISLTIIYDDTKLATSKYSWIIIVLALPIAGVVLYLIFGLGHMNSYRKRILENSRLSYSELTEYQADDSRLDANEKTLVHYLDNMRYKTSYLHYGGDIKYYMFGREKYNDLIEDIKNAKSYIHLEYYIIKSGVLFEEFKHALIKKAHEGVEVKIVSDYLGGRFLSDEDIKILRDNNIEIYFFNKFKINMLSKISNFRDHRKMAIIDGEIAYTGGFNIGDEYIDLNEYYQHWQDFSIRIANSPVVLEYETFFAQMWFYESKEMLFTPKYYPKYDLENVNKETLVYTFLDGPDSEETFIRDMFVKVIMSATKSLYIATPYFIPDTVVYDAILIQANSGIDITLVTPGLPDKKSVKLATESYYPELLKSGVKIFEYNGFIHAKKLLADDRYALVGTANLDMRSFNLSFEVCTLLFGGSIIKGIKDTFEYEIVNANPIKLKNLKKVPYYKKILQVLLRLFAPMF